MTSFPPSPEARLRRMMKPYEGAQHTVVGMSLAQGQTDFVRAGQSLPDTRSEEVMFEIGSITKVFAAILLCVLVEDGKIDPKAPLRDMSDDLSPVPDWITPERLISHTSGLPSYYMPVWKALIRQKSDQPYADFSRADLLSWMQQHGGKARPKKFRYAYSNLGVGLLGDAMSIMEGRPFIDLLSEKVLRPSGLVDTVQHMSEAQETRFPAPRLPNGKPVPAWEFQSLAAAGCLRSSLGDLARFSQCVLKALSEPETKLDRALVRSVVPILGLGPRGAVMPTAQCSGWLNVTLDKATPSYLFHNGGTAGSSCALFICPAKSAALAVLSNNGVVGNLWRGIRLNHSNQFKQAHDYFAAR